MNYLFETEHLRVRRFEAEDAKQLYENHLEEEMKQWIPNESYESLEEAAGAIAFYQSCVAAGRLPYVLAVEHRETGELIGDTGVNEVEGASGEVEIGYSICRKYSGLGYATELLEAMTRFVVELFGVQVLYGRVMRGNDASVKVLEKCGYSFLREEYGAEDDPYGRGMRVYAFLSERSKEMNFDINKLKWTREPKEYFISEDKIEITTKPHTDLWQRTYYHFRNDNAPVLQMATDEKYFSFTVKTEFESKHRFDQCGVVMYLDSENWLKGSIEYENETFQHLGSVVTNNGYSDWATTAIDASVKSMWYRFSRREDDYCIECSADGIHFSQMRVCHMWNGKGTIQFGIYACSPEDSSFKATFTNFEMTECKWLAHDGQEPDEDLLL